MVSQAVCLTLWNLTPWNFLYYENFISLCILLNCLNCFMSYSMPCFVLFLQLKKRLVDSSSLPVIRTPGWSLGGRPKEGGSAVPGGAQLQGACRAGCLPCTGVAWRACLSAGSTTAGSTPSVYRLQFISLITTLHIEGSFTAFNPAAELAKVCLT